MKTQLELLQSQYRIYIHKLNSSYNRHKQKEYQDELSRIRKEIEDLESADRVIDEERKRQLKFKLNIPPKVQEKYKREDTRFKPYIKEINRFVPNKKEKIIVRIKLINAKQDEERIRNVLRHTNNNILKHITSITVHDSKFIPDSKTKPLGTASFDAMSHKLYFGHIDIISSKFYDSSMNNTFENTLNHEIGHIAGASISRVL